MKAVARVQLRLLLPSMPALLAPIMALLMLTGRGIAADDAHGSADSHLTAAASDSAKPGAIDARDAEWIKTLANLKSDRKGRRFSNINDDRGNVAFINDDGDVVGLCSAGPSSDTSTINDAFVREFLTRFPKVNRMYLRDTPEVTDDGLEPLARQTGLHKLIIASPKVTDAGIARLTKLNQLESLLINSDKVTDKAVESISQLTALKQLSLNGTQVSHDGIQRLKSSLPKCSVYVSGK
jgi:hypothetical protein